MSFSMSISGFQAPQLGANLAITHQSALVYSIHARRIVVYFWNI